MTKEEIVKKLKGILDNSPEYKKELKKLEEEYYHDLIWGKTDEPMLM